MLEKLVEVLGEELSSQVSTKLQEAKIELAIFNDGSVVPATKYDSLKAENRELEAKYDADVKDFSKKLEDATKGVEDYDTIKKTLEQMKLDTDDLIAKTETEKANIKIESAFEVELIKNNVDEAYLPLFKKQLDMDKVKLEGEEVTGLKELVDTFRTTYPKSFGEVKKAGAQPSMDGKTPDASKKSQLVEAYNQAQKAGDAKKMFAINKQIKELKE